MNIKDKGFRSALGKFSTGVCLVSFFNENGAPIGITINSFASISLDPQVISWSIKKKSMCYGLFSGINNYAVSVLSKDQVGLSNRYAVSGDHIMDPAEYYISDSGLPIVNNSISHFECNRWKDITVGDHDIILGKVAGYASERDARPLVFFGGMYRGLECVT
ncbi:MAG: flavin reductase family protein [Oleispira sp.]|nr:flavin reductase family protein [Oleispira sp.]